MPKRKQRKVKAPPKEQLALSKDEHNTKGSKEERARALQMFVDDFDIQALSVSKQLVKQFERALTTSAIGRFDALVKQIPKEMLDMPYEELLRLGSEKSTTAVEEVEGSTLSSCQEAMRQKKREELVAELEAQIEEGSTSMNPSVLVTPANAPMPAAVPLTITTQGRNPRQGEAIILTAMSARGSPISLCAFKDALSLRQDLTPYITATSRRAL